MRHRPQQMGLAAARRPMQVQRIMLEAGLLDDPPAGGERDLIAGIFKESVKGPGTADRRRGLGWSAIQIDDQRADPRRGMSQPSAAGKAN